MSALEVIVLAVLSVLVAVFVGLFGYAGRGLWREGNRPAAWLTWGVAGLVTVLWLLLLTSR